VGGNGAVDLAFDVLTGKHVVLKRVCMKEKADARKEGEIHAQLSFLHHPNISEFVGMYLEEDDNLTIVSEYCQGGDLLDHVKINEGLPEEQAVGYVIQLLDALAHMHEAGIAHADVKIDNCCLDANGTLKVIDFGGSVSVAELVNSTFCPGSSTLTYTAPEVLNNKCYDPRTADVWAAGIVLYTLLCGSLPWEIASSRDHSYLRHWRGDEALRWRSISKNIREILHVMLAVSPKERIVAREAYDRLQKILNEKEQ